MCLAFLTDCRHLLSSCLTSICCVPFAYRDYLLLHGEYVLDALDPALGTVLEFLYHFVADLVNDVELAVALVDLQQLEVHRFRLVGLKRLLEHLHQRLLVPEVVLQVQVGRPKVDSFRLVAEVYHSQRSFGRRPRQLYSY